MSANSKIEWTDHTFNPWIGCTKVSPGCDHCYAEVSTPARTLGVAWGAKAERHRTTPANWNLPRRWNAQHDNFFAEHGRRQRVFCSSLADVFDNAVNPAWRVDLLQLIADTPNLDWLLLTKRIGNAHEMLNDALAELSHDLTYWEEAPWPNVWFGATITSQAEADRDIPKLLELPARVRFLSMEPLLGPVDVSRWLDPTGIHCMDVCADTQYVKDDEVETCTANGECVPLCPACGLSASWTGYDDGLDWVIVGGESGPGARPMHPDWARSLRDQCAAAGVPFLYKQHGDWREPLEGERYDTTMGLAQRVPAFIVTETGTVHCFENEQTVDGGRVMLRVGKKAAGRLLDGVQHDGFPEASR